MHQTPSCICGVRLGKSPFVQQGSEWDIYSSSLPFRRLSGEIAAHVVNPGTARETSRKKLRVAGSASIFVSKLPSAYGGNSAVDTSPLLEV